MSQEFNADHLVADHLPPETLRIDIRPATKDDVSWVYSSWLKSFREHGSSVGRIRREVYWEHHRRLVERTTSREGVLTLIATPSDIESQILGWLCASRDTHGDRATIFYAHVKSEYRRRGIGRALCQALGITDKTTVSYTHHTKVSWREDGHTRSNELGRIVPPSWIYNPYLFA